MEWIIPEEYRKEMQVLKVTVVNNNSKKRVKFNKIVTSQE